MSITRRQASPDDEDKKTKCERGLLFVCYQTSIQEQFEHVQMRWANNTKFAPNKKRPSDHSTVVPGHDPIIGQSTEAEGRRRTMDEPVPNYPVGDTRSQLVMPEDFVVPTGAGYFFLPSITALSTVLT